MISFLPWILFLLGAYLIGSFPTGYLAGRCCGIDLRLHGSGNIGATNALRVLNKKWGYTVFIVDFLKGFIACYLAVRWGYSSGIQPLSLPGGIAAIGVLLGHSFPVWLGFHGGKGIATSAGIIIALFPAAFLFCCLSWIVVFNFTKYVSVASLAASALLPISVGILYSLTHFYPGLPSFFQQDWFSFLIAIVMGLLAILRHRSNIKRLLEGTEPQFERGKKNSPSL